jgi:hypothetical protein
MPPKLEAKQTACCAVAGVADLDLVGAGVVGRVIGRLCGDGERIEACSFGFVVAEAGPCDGLVEDFDDLGAETSYELACPPRAFSPAMRPCL